MRQMCTTRGNGVWRCTPIVLWLWLCCVSTLAAVPDEQQQQKSNLRRKYEPNWASLDERPLPQWYEEAKIGIFLHWGVYSVPSYGSEWFWTDWINLKIPGYVEFMERNYPPNFAYQDFARDFTAELFNATQWAQLFSDSGAKYVVLTSKHHDGYALWPSKQSFSWNAMDVGPKRDIIRELSAAIRAESDLKFGLYYSLFEWFNRQYVDDKLHIFLQQTYVDRKVRPEQIELVEQYLPEVIWSDGDWEAPAKYWKAEEFIAWLYNDSPVRDTVVTNDRWGFGTACRHGDFYNCADRFNPGTLQPHKWENAFTLDKQSWGQRFDTKLADYMSSKELIKEIVSTVACNGNVLINVGPTKYGTIQPIFEERLRDMGSWLRVNGEAIYASTPWLFQNDSVTPGVWYTRKNHSDAGSFSVYAIVLDYPYDTNEIDLYPLGSGANDIAALLLNGVDFADDSVSYREDSMEVVLLGMERTQIQWTTTNKKLHIVFPPKHHIDRQQLQLAWTFKITFN